MEAGIANRTIEANSKNIGKHAQAWHLAQEFEQAVDLYRQAALLDPTDGHSLQVASIFIQLRQWQPALSALQNNAQIKKDGRFYNLVGYLNFELGHYENSANAYKNGLKFESSRAEAQSWLTYIESL